MSRRLLLLGALALAGCAKKSNDSALGVTVSFVAAAKSHCVQVVVVPASGAAVRSGPATRVDTTDLKIAVYRAELPADVTV